MPLDRALHDLRNILASPSLVLFGETERHADVMAPIVEAPGAAGSRQAVGDRE